MGKECWIARIASKSWSCLDGGGTDHQNFETWGACSVMKIDAFAAVEVVVMLVAP